MDLKGVSLTQGDYEQLLVFIQDRKLAYQPFRFDAEHEVGEGMAVLSGASTERRKGVVVWPSAPEDIADLVVAPEAIAAFRAANQDLRRIYDHFLATILADFHNDLAELDFAEFGCNTGYFVHSLSRCGARRSIGLDFTYNQQVFEFFNEKLKTTSEFIFSEWDSFRHSPRYNEVPEVDVCLSVAVLCHLADPLHHLTYLCSRARKAVFVWTPSHDRDDLSMSFGTPSAFRNSLTWPVSFDNLVKPSRGLIELCLKECGFEDLQHVEPIRTRFDEIGFWNHHTGILAKRTRSAATAYTGGLLRRPLPAEVPDAIAADDETSQPQLVATIKRQNIVRSKGVYYTVPHHLGELDVAEAAKQGVAEIVPWPSLAAAREAAERSDAS